MILADDPSFGHGTCQSTMAGHGELIEVYFPSRIRRSSHRSIYIIELCSKLNALFRELLDL